MLADGWSLARIGREVGRDASTVAYWVRKHRLRAVHADRVAPRGGIPRDRLARLVAAGLTIRQIAVELEVGTATVRHWLGKYGFRTVGAERRRRASQPRLRPRHVVRQCRKHGPTRFVLEGRGYYRCTRCRVEQVSERRRKVKRILIEEAGGSCAVCGYNRYAGALQFHHLNRAAKSFELSLRGETPGIEELRTEARKCILLCANCHAEVEAGLHRAAHEKGRPQAA
jgi:5-methylcytosine-specific restriction endonuclease McrA